MFLVLGVIVNVAVAWGCVIRAHYLRIPVVTSDAAEYASTWERLALPGWNAEPTSGSHAYEFGVRYLDASAPVSDGHASSGKRRLLSAKAGQSSRSPTYTFAGYGAGEMCAGWPIFVMRYVTFYDNGQSRIRGLVIIPTAIAGRTGGFIVPVQPVWPGIAINTAVYAVVLWLLFAGPFVLRRWRRIRRGLCVKCAYDLRGTPRGAAASCPECGAAVIQHA